MLCKAPWVHFHNEINGDVTPCCINTETLGTIKQASPEQVFYSAKHAEFRQQMLGDSLPASCTQCQRKIDQNLESYRDTFERYKIVDQDKFEPVTLDTRFSNICNLTCVSCGSWASSAWAALENHTPIFIKNSAPDFLPSLLTDKIKMVYYAGGEPFMTKEFFDMLLYLKQHDLDPQICINTNCTTFTYKGRSVFDYLQGFSNVTLLMSIDSTGKRIEAIRRGTVWHTVVENLKLLHKYDFNLIVQPVLSVLNCMYLDEDWTLLSAILPPAKLNPLPLYGPEFLSLDSLSQFDKRFLVNKVKHSTVNAALDLFEYKASFLHDSTMQNTFHARVPEWRTVFPKMLELPTFRLIK